MTTFKHAYTKAHTTKLSKIYNQYKQKYSELNKSITSEEKIEVLNSMLNKLKFPGEPVSYDELYDELEFRLDDVEYEDHAFDMLSEYPDFDVHTFYYDEDELDLMDLDWLLELEIETYSYIVRLRKMLEPQVPPQKPTTTTTNYCDCWYVELSGEELEALLQN